MFGDNYSGFTPAPLHKTHPLIPAGIAGIQIPWMGLIDVFLLTFSDQEMRQSDVVGSYQASQMGPLAPKFTMLYGFHIRCGDIDEDTPASPREHVVC
ncbi:hypothetical protein TI04_04510 [Achromatium sp. WMS2]|nr:hypothetical protein TI04_04510 [Achromatium sp. WMS2]